MNHPSALKMVAVENVSCGDMVALANNGGCKLYRVRNRDEIEKTRRVRRFATKTLFRHFRQHGIKIGKKEKKSIIENIVSMTEPKMPPIVGIAASDCKKDGMVTVVTSGVIGVNIR
jgi:hypothetical protein